MRLDLGLVLRDGHKHLGDSVTDVVLDHKTNKEHGQNHTYAGIDKIQSIIHLRIEP